MAECRKSLSPSHTDDGDLVSGIIAGIDLIEDKCRNLKYKRNIIVLSNATGHMDFNEKQIKSIVEKLKQRNTTLKILFVERYDGSEGVKSEWPNDFSTRERYESNKENLVALCDTLGGESVSGSCEEAIYSISIPRPKQVRPIKTFFGMLKLGNSDNFGNDRTINISVEVYPFVRKALPPSSTSYFQSEKGELRTVKYVRDYFIVNPDEPDEKQEIEKNELASGYRFGTEIVTFNEEDKIILKGVATSAGLEVIGFISSKKVPRWASMGYTDVLVARTDYIKDAIALSSFIHSLYETETIAIARYVPKNDSDIQIISLAPFFDVDFEALIVCQLPFEEDCRQFRFPSLLEVKNKMGEIISDGMQKRARYPSEQMDRVMEAYINKMDLMTADDGEEYMINEEVFNPAIHRIQQIIKECAISHDNENLPSMLPIFKKYSGPKESTLEDCVAEVEMMHELFEIEKVDRKKSKKNIEGNNNNLVAKENDLNLDDLLSL